MKAADTEALRRYRMNWQSEVDGAALYRTMAEAEKTPTLARVYSSLAEIEEKHMVFWENRLKDLGHQAGPRKPSWRTRVLVWSARRWGARVVLPSVASQEYLGRNDYLPQQETAGTGMTGEERMHARVLATVLSKATGLEGSAIGRLEGVIEPLAAMRCAPQCSGRTTGCARI